MTVWPRYQKTHVTTVEGRKVYAIDATVFLIRFTPIPCYLIDTWDWLVIDGDHDWKLCGTFGHFLPDPLGSGGRYELLGTHLPEAVKAEMLEWAEQYVRTYSDTPLIPVSQVAYQRNNYTTLKKALITFHTYESLFNEYREKYDPGVRALQPKPNKFRGARTRKGERDTGKPSRARTQALDGAPQPEAATLFD